MTGDAESDRAGELISLAEAAAAKAQWLEALDLASQALTIDPAESRAAVMVGTARARLGSISTPAVELRQVTVIAIDTHRSTAIAAALGPERWRELMLELYEVCVEAVSRFEGRVSKFLGDGVLAQFGYPVVHEDDPRRAVLAALVALEEVAGRAASWKQRFGHEVQVRAGIDSGVAAIGPMDASPWSGDEIAGDPPNIATRVEATAKPMSVRITDSTHALVRGWFETEPVGPVELKNYPDPVFLHRVLHASEAETRLDAGGSARPPLLGRDAELKRLRDAWGEVVASGGRRVVSISGEAGIGKSRLVEHLIATAVATGSAQITLPCSQLHRHSPLRPLAHGLARFFAVPPSERTGDALYLDAVRRKLAQLGDGSLATKDSVPIYGWLLGLRSGVDIEPDLLRRQAFAATIDLLEALAENSRLILCVDDADLADPSTVLLLEELLSRPPLPMLVAFTARGSIGSLGDHVDLGLELRGLPGEQAMELIAAVAPELDPEAAARIVARSGGVPYLLEEQARTSHELPVSRDGGPLQLSVFLAARLDELGAEAKRLLGEVAVAGGKMRVEAMRALSDEPAEALERRLSDLCAQRVLVRIAEGGVDAVHFRHDLMRQAAYDGMLEATRAKLHASLAGYLAGDPGRAEPEDVARHYGLGGDDSSAALWWAEAGAAASASGAYSEAIELFEHSLEALERVPGGEARDALELNVQLGLGSAHSTLDGYTAPEARAGFDRAIVLGEQVADTTTIFPALWGAWSYWFVLGEHELARGLADRCLRIGIAAEDERVRLGAAAIVGYQRLYLGEFDGACEELSLAGHHVDLEPAAAIPQDPGIVSLSALSVALWLRGEAERSAEIAAMAQSLAEAADPKARRTGLTRAWVGCTLAWRAQLAGDSEGAITLAEAAEKIAGDRGYATWLAAATLHRSIAQCALGDLDQGMPTLEAMVAAWRSAGLDAAGRRLHPVLMTPYFAGRLAEARLAAGDAEGAGALVEELLAETAQSGERFWDAELERLRSSIQSRRNPTEARPA